MQDATSSLSSPLSARVRVCVHTHIHSLSLLVLSMLGVFKEV